jgi:Rieske Fe-S protein
MEKPMQLDPSSNVHPRTRDAGVAANGTVTRRTAIAGAGALAAVAALAGCSTYGNTDTPSPTTAAAGGSSSGGGTTGGAGAGLATSADIPVGGGKIFKDQKVVVTQPTAGSFKAFDATCTHQGCIVNSISNGKIGCPCHGSQFNLDGTVAQGPASSSLAAKQVTVTGDSISVA